MITFIVATITFVFIISWFYVFLRSDLKGLLGHSVALVLLMLLNIVALLMSISFMLASITPSPFDAQIYTRFAIILFRLGTVLLFIFSETVRRSRFFLVKVFGVSTILGVNIATYHSVSFKFQKFYGFWERNAVLAFRTINIVDLALYILLLLLMVISLLFTTRSALRRIRTESKRSFVARHYYLTESVIIISCAFFLINRFFGPGIIINNVVILISIMLILAILITSVLKYPYLIYAGHATLLGVMIISQESGVLIYEEGLISGGLFVSGVFWTITKMMEESFGKKPYIISFFDFHLIINYVGPIIGVYLFDTYFEELKIFSRYVSETLAKNLRKNGLIGGLFIEDDEVRHKIVQVIRKTLDPFIP